MIEIIGFDLEGCRIAQENGAERIELCAAYELGGITPSNAIIVSVVESISLPIFLMIRPRGGGFVYSLKEVNAMEDAIDFGIDVGVDGFVFGALTEKQEINIPVCKRLINKAQGKPCTFHRAFDETVNPFVALETLKELGFIRVLTSGQQPTASQGKNLLKKLIMQAEEYIIVMPGAGVTAKVLHELDSFLNAKEYHSSAKLTDQTTKYKGVDGDEVSKMVAILKHNRR